MRPEDVGLSRDLQFFKPKEVVDGNTRVTYTTIYKCENFSVSFPIFSFIKKKVNIEWKGVFIYICVRFISWWDYMIPKAISERDFELSFFSLIWHYYSNFLNACWSKIISTFFSCAFSFSLQVQSYLYTTIQEWLYSASF